MEFESSFWQILGSLAVFVVGAGLCLAFRRIVGGTLQRTLLIYVWHTLFCVVNWAYSLRFGSDSLAYYRGSQNHEVAVGLGTAFITYFTSIFSSHLHLSYFGVFLVFNVIGAIGLLAFDRSLQFATFGGTRVLRSLATTIVFLPSASFWTASIGKDPISFAVIGFALWSMVGLRKNGLVLMVSIVILFLVRPHIASLLACTLVISTLAQSRVDLSHRILFGALALGIIGLILPVSIQYVGLGDASNIEDVFQYMEHREAITMIGGSAMEMSQMNIPFKLFTYAFRPLPFDAHNGFSLAISFENIFLLCIALVGSWGIITQLTRHLSAEKSCLWFYVISCWLVLGLTTSNLGIAVRQKWMFLSFLLWLLISAIGKRYMRVARV